MPQTPFQSHYTLCSHPLEPKPFVEDENAVWRNIIVCLLLGFPRLIIGFAYGMGRSLRLEK